MLPYLSQILYSNETGEQLFERENDSVCIILAAVRSIGQYASFVGMFIRL